MPIAEKITALLDGLDSAELDRMRPVDRRKFAALCHHWWQLAEHRDRSGARKGSAAALGICPSCGEAAKPEQPTCGEAACVAQEPPRTGVLSKLEDGERAS